MDLDSGPSSSVAELVAPYAGHGKVARLLFIATQSPDFRDQALRMAIEELRNRSQNTAKYCDLCNRCHVPTDAAWVAQADEEAAQQLARLEHEEQNAKASNVRESMRQAAMALGSFHYSRGDYMAASKSFMRARERCHTNQDVQAFCAAVVRTYVQMANWPMVLTYVNKADSGAAAKADAAAAPAHAEVSAQLAATGALAEMALNRTAAAAQSFARVGAALGNAFDDVVTSVDIARYGTLCALAAHDRAWIRRELLGSSTFALHLEAFPEARDLLEAMVSGRYAAAFAALDAMKPTLALDMYLSPLLASLLQSIRVRVLRQHVKPYKSLRIEAMAEALGSDPAALESEVVSQIAQGELDVVVDSHRKVLHRREEGSGAAANVLRAADEYISAARCMLLRTKLMKCGLRPTAPPEAQRGVPRGAHPAGWPRGMRGAGDADTVPFSPAVPGPAGTFGGM